MEVVHGDKQPTPDRSWLPQMGRVRSEAGGFRRGEGSTLRTAFWHVTGPFIGHRHVPRAGTLAIQMEIGYNTIMAVLQLIVVATLVSVLYVYLRQSNQD
jgi:hypothetical protein